MIENKVKPETKKLCWKRFGYVPGDLSKYDELLVTVTKIAHSLKSEWAPHVNKAEQNEIYQLDLRANSLIIRIKLILANLHELWIECEKQSYGVKEHTISNKQVLEIKSKIKKIKKDILDFSNDTSKLLEKFEQKGRL